MRLREYLEQNKNVNEELTEDQGYDLFNKEFFSLTRQQAEDFIFNTDFDEDPDFPTVKPNQISQEVFDKLVNSIGFNLFNVEQNWDVTTMEDYIDHYYVVKDYTDILDELGLDLTTLSESDLDDIFVEYLLDHEDVAIRLPYIEDFSAYYFKEVGEPVSHALTWTDDSGIDMDVNNILDVCLNNIVG